MSNPAPQPPLGSDTILAVSQRFFRQEVLPLVTREFPAVAERGAFGLFGYGSEAYGMDDALSRDHHWGLRIDALLPEELYAEVRAPLLETLARELPASFEGQSLREGHVAGAGLAPDSLEGFLRRTIGLPGFPRDDAQWLTIPEEDIFHVINGEVWHDPSGEFTRVREAFQSYYPHNVWKRRIAHWCRYYSGMGVYALHRAVMRRNDFYASAAFGKAVRWAVQLAFLLERTYYPYDKWLMAYFERLPVLHLPLRPLVDEAVSIGSSWERKLELLNNMSDVLDARMVELGLIRPHPRLRGSPTSGYRLLERAYAELIRGLPPQIRDQVPVWDQVHLEAFHSVYVAGLSPDHWDRLLCLTPSEE